MEFDDEQLVELVRQFPILFDKKDPNFENKLYYFYIICINTQQGTVNLKICACAIIVC